MAMFAIRTSRYVVIAAAVLTVAALVACQRSSTIDLPSPQSPGGGDLGGGGGGGEPEGESAFFVSYFKAADYEPYLDLNARLEYKFSYLGTTDQGALDFQNGVATLQVGNLPANQAGEMRIELLENRVVKLQGAQTVTLQPGNNDVEFRLKQAGDDGGNGDDGGGNGGDDRGSVNITIIIVEEGGDDNGGGSAGSGGGSGGGSVDFAREVRPLAERYCGRCHGNRGVDSENFWQGGAGYSKAQVEGSISGGGSLMPQPGSPESQTMSQQERDLLLRYLRG